jgi:hypothetical protein
VSILDRLYKSNPKDIASGGSSIIRRFGETLVAGAGTATIGATGSTVPPDLVRLITSIAMVWNATVVNPVSGTFNILSETSTQIIQGVGLQVPFTPPVGINAAATIGGLALLALPGDQMNMGGYFSAAGGSNSLICYICGYEFARGSISR